MLLSMGEFWATEIWLFTRAVRRCSQDTPTCDLAFLILSLSQGERAATSAVWAQILVSSWQTEYRIQKFYCLWITQKSPYDCIKDTSKITHRTIHEHTGKQTCTTFSMAFIIPLSCRPPLSCHYFFSPSVCLLLDFSPFFSLLKKKWFSANLGLN